jgi:predicted GNAT family acetyltransferase
VSEVQVVRDEAAGRFEVRDGDEVLGVAEYLRDGSVLTFTHTVVQPSDEHKGLGSTLVAAALQAAREEGAQVVPRCSFVRAYLRRHPEELDLVPDDVRAGLTA